jgi:REP element-mobilizing transposase RayT
MAYWRTYYHIVWTTKHREPLVGPAFEREVYRAIGEQCVKNGGLIHAVNGMPDHVHVVVSIPPAISVSDFVGRMKGSSSHYINTVPGIPFEWQRGFGILSVGRRQVHIPIDYVRRQKDHHAAHSLLYEALERTTNTDDRPDPFVDDPYQMTD